jgi:nucleoside transporter
MRQRGKRKLAPTAGNLTPSFLLTAENALQPSIPLAVLRLHFATCAVQKNHWLRDYSELAALFFIHAMALGMWFVPLGSVLDANGYHDIKAYAFATSGISAFISPLLFGALADQRVSPVRLLRWLGLATAAAMALASTGISQKWDSLLVLALIQLHALCSAPTWSLSTTIVFARVRDPKREFGPIRAMATVGWVIGCWLVSAIDADRSALAGYGGSIIWLTVVLFTYTLPVVAPPAPTSVMNWKQRLGLDALTLLRHRDHRVVFLATALFNIPLCAFYPYTPSHLRELGFEHTTAWMTFGQATEILAMFLLAGLLTRWRLKTIFLTGIAFGVLRYAACALDTKFWVLVGVTMHGCAFTLYLITTQIYLEQRIDPMWRARAQALYVLMLSGVGNTLGYLGCGWWSDFTTTQDQTNWPVFWAGLSCSVAVIWIWFAVSYRGRQGEPSTAAASN